MGSVQSLSVVSDNGTVLTNGLGLPNGFALGNGQTLTNGINLSNGLGAGGGLSNGINIPIGIVSPQSGSDLEKWIEVDPPMRKRTLKYMVQCALPSTKSVTLTYKGSSESYTGLLNLAPGWAISPAQMSTTEQEKVSACLLSRVNESGAIVQINLIGPSSLGAGWSTRTSADAAAYPDNEAAFAGNLFVFPPKVFVCGGGAFSYVDPNTHVPTIYNSRACGGTGSNSSCSHDSNNNWECLGSCSSIIKFDTNCFTTCNQAPSRGGVDPYFYDCTDVNNGRTWSNVVTSYFIKYNFGHACGGNWQCVSGLCSSGFCN